MGSPSVSTHRGLVHWQGLLLVVSLLSFWSQPTTAQISIASTYGAEGQDVVLRILNKPPEVLGIVWYKGQGVDKNNVIAFFIMTSSFYLSGPENDGREILTDDGSLMLKNVTLQDAGMYTIVAHLPDSKQEIGFGLLAVYEPVRAPPLLASSTTVTEHKTAVAMTSNKYGPTLCLFSHRNLQFRRKAKLFQNHRHLTIDPSRKEDAGDYQCQVSNLSVLLKVRPLEMDVKHV